MKSGWLLNSIGFLVLIACTPRVNKSSLTQAVQQRFNQVNGTFAVAFKNLQSGETLFINEHESFHAASTMKTPVMIELYKQAEAGKFDLDDSLFVKDEFYSIVDSSIFKMDVGVDSEAKLYDLVGQQLPIRELMYEMITMSSNLATNILIDLVDAKQVTQSMRELGAPDIQVLRGVEDLKAFEQGLSNSTTAYDLMVIYEQIATQSILSKEACNEMIEVLTAQHFNDMIPMHLPADVTVAHKTGAITGVHHDSGLVTLPDGTQYVLVLLSKEMDDFDAGTAMLAEVSKMIYDWVVQE